MFYWWSFCRTLKMDFILIDTSLSLTSTLMRGTIAAALWLLLLLLCIIRLMVCGLLGLLDLRPLGHILG